MKRSLYIMFFLAWLVFGLAGFVIVSLVSSRLTYNRSLRNTANRLYAQARQISTDYSQIYTGGKLSAGMQTQLQGLGHYTEERIWFIHTDGTISYDSAGQMTDHVIQDFDPATPPSFYRTGRFYNCFREDMLSVIAPITANFTTYGYVVIHHSLEDVALESDRMLIPLYITLAIIYVLSLFIFLLIHVYIMLPLRKITFAAGEYSSGNLNHTISINANDEFGRLADTLNLMADELSASENYQKQFIANVSHDFRSPLTSIKGYLQAITDGVIPPEDITKYINVVIHETDRLENLTQSMLSLNSLERKNMHLEFSDFDICRLVRGVCETFEGKCRRKDITFDLIFSAPEVAVHADLGRIQQVLYNLIDNAIKFSNNDSSITISVREIRNRVLISVKDTGVGIPREDLKQIWNRFFKSDQSRGRDKYGTGLGLSIVKEIITAHGETIDAISTEGAGSEFIFRLPSAHREEPEESLL